MIGNDVVPVVSVDQRDVVSVAVFAQAQDFFVCGLHFSHQLFGVVESFIRGLSVAVRHDEARCESFVHQLTDNRTLNQAAQTDAFWCVLEVVSVCDVGVAVALGLLLEIV